MKRIDKEIWEPSDGIILEESAKQSITSQNNILVIAGPGAGKTELLAQKATYLLQTNLCKEPQKILAISFKTDSAQNLKERVEKRCGQDAKSRFSSMTYDAFFKRILDHFLYALPEELRPNTDYLINDLEIIDQAFIHQGVFLDGTVNSKFNKHHDKTLKETILPLNTNDFGSKIWSLLLKGFDNHKATLTFKMINKLADYIILTNEQIKLAIQKTYSHVFLDEFQDTTDLQYKFIKDCFLGSNSIITAVGDNKQRIMLWAGAMKNVFEIYNDEFKSEQKVLLMNHRSAPKLVELQRKMYESLQEENLDIKYSEKWNSSDGEINLFISDNEELEANAIANDIEKKISKGIKPNDICILCKQKPQDYSPAIEKALKEKGIRSRIEINYQDLIKEPIIQLILDIISCSINIKQAQKWETIKDCVINIFSINSDTATYEELQNQIFDLRNKLKNMIEQKCDISDIINTINSFLDTNRIKAYFPAYSQGKYFDTILDRFIELFNIEFAEANQNWQNAIDNFCGLNSIPIMTIHKSKGLEYSAVYFVGLEDSAFWNFKNQPEEDRCTFFVALSRAKCSVTFTFSNVRSGLKYPKQKKDAINEFFELLQNSGIANVIFYRN